MGHSHFSPTSTYRILGIQVGAEQGVEELFPMMLVARYRSNLIHYILACFGQIATTYSQLQLSKCYNQSKLGDDDTMVASLFRILRTTVWGMFFGPLITMIALIVYSVIGGLFSGGLDGMILGLSGALYYAGAYILYLGLPVGILGGALGSVVLTVLESREREQTNSLE